MQLGKLLIFSKFQYPQIQSGDDNTSVIVDVIEHNLCYVKVLYKVE